MNITLRDFVDGNEKATLQFASYGVKRPVYSYGVEELPKSKKKELWKAKEESGK
jgi:hypothetical protein